MSICLGQVLPSILASFSGVLVFSPFLRNLRRRGPVIPRGMQQIRGICRDFDCF